MSCICLVSLGRDSLCSADVQALEMEEELAEGQAIPQACNTHDVAGGDTLHTTNHQVQGNGHCRGDIPGCKGLGPFLAGARPGALFLDSVCSSVWVVRGRD